MDFRQEQRNLPPPVSPEGLPPLQVAWTQSCQPGVARASGQAHSQAPAPSHRAVQVTMVTSHPHCVRAPVPASGRQGQVRVSWAGAAVRQLAAKHGIDPRRRVPTEASEAGGGGSPFYI